ncbi:MAG: MarC family protein [Deltaproteobacteria bacterium]|nr:MarC family protein [Deltaproteobacteria bacterium]
MLKVFTEVLVPLFVAMGPLTVLPIFLSLTEGASRKEKRQFARRGVLAGAVVATVVVLAGQELFRFLGITVDDLRVAGGAILFLIASHDLVFSRDRRKRGELEALDVEAGVVPLGTPLIVGPATMTAAVVLADTHGRIPVFVGLALNLALIFVILHYSDQLERFLKPSATRAFGKVMSLFLAAIAVAMLRTGILSFWTMMQ